MDTWQVFHPRRGDFDTCEVWRHVLKLEIGTIIDKGTFGNIIDEDDLPRDAELIHSLLADAIKRTGDGVPYRAKCRLVARGDQEKIESISASPVESSFATKLQIAITRSLGVQCTLLSTLYTDSPEGGIRAERGVETFLLQFPTHRACCISSRVEFILIIFSKLISKLIVSVTFVILYAFPPTHFFNIFSCTLT